MHVESGVCMQFITANGRGIVEIVEIWWKNMLWPGALKCIQVQVPQMQFTSLNRLLEPERDGGSCHHPADISHPPTFPPTSTPTPRNNCNILAKVYAASEEVSPPVHSLPALNGPKPALERDNCSVLQTWWRDVYFAQGKQFIPCNISGGSERERKRESEWRAREARSLIAI